LAPSALIVVEEDKRASFKTPAGFAELDRRKKGDTELIFCTPS
jgi:16S rRNA G966 N2-methylase RsmD